MTALVGYSVPTTITDDAGNVLKGLSVQVTGPASYTGTAVTDPGDGELRLGPLPVGDYTVTNPLSGRSATIPVVATAVDVQAAFDKAAAAIPAAQKAAANGVASLDSSGTVPDAQIPSTIARDAEVSTAVSAAVTALVGSASASLDTLGEIAAQLAADESAAAALTTAVGQRAITVNHGATAGTARPTSSLPVRWFGTVAPTNATTNDLWYDQTNDLWKRYNGSAWVTAGSETYPPLRSGSNAAGNFLQKLREDTGNLSVLILSDSTATPLGPATSPWPNQVAALLGAKYPAQTWKLSLFDGTSAYPAASTVTTGTGSNTVTIYNCSVAGVQTSYVQGSLWAAAVQATAPDLIIVAYGHNETTTIADLFRARYLALTEQVRLVCPKADVLCMAQNPHTDASGSMAQWAIEIGKVCALRGYGLINIYDLFLTNPSWTSAWMNNSVHPNNTGSGIIAAEVLAHLTQADTSQGIRPSPPSSLAETAPNVGLANADFAQFDGTTVAGWSVTGSVTLSKDTTNYESPNGYAVKLTASGTNASLSANLPVSRYKGKWVTFAARVFIPAASAGGTGRIAISDSTGGSVVSLADTEGQGGWKWLVVTRKIADAATYIVVWLYASDGSVSSGNFSVDRVSVCEGLMPRETLSLPRSGLLAITSYAPGTLTDRTTTTTGSTLVALDATNLTVSFVAPPSGRVLVKLIGTVKAAAGNVVWGLLAHGTSTQVGPASSIYGPDAGYCPTPVPVLVTGLTPGTVYQYDWAAVTDNAGHANGVSCYSGLPLLAASGAGPAVMEVWAA